MKTKTQDLTGNALRWAVGIADGGGAKLLWRLMQTQRWQPDTDWSQGGPIIEREKIDVMWCGDRWCAYAMTPDKETQLVEDGPTPLVAAMRGYVASRLGDEVDIPEELA